MSLRFNEIENLTLHESDGDMGHIVDVLYDDESFQIRHLVVSNRTFLPGEKLLLHPHDVVSMDHLRAFVDLTREALEQLPPYESALPVSQQYRYRSTPDLSVEPDWTHDTAAWFPYPGYLQPHMNSAQRSRTSPELESMIEARRRAFDPHLRSCRELRGYRIESADGQVFGEVTDVMIDIDHWYMIDMILDSRKWLPGGKRFTCSPVFVGQIDEASHRVKLSVSKDILLESPRFQAAEYREHSRVALMEHHLNEHFRHEQL